MNVRTNFRTWRDKACFYVQVGLRGSEANPHVYAELKAIAVDTLSEIALTEKLSKYVANDKLYVLSDARNAKEAIDEAIRLFKAEPDRG